MDLRPRFLPACVTPVRAHQAIAGLACVHRAWLVALLVVVLALLQACGGGGGTTQPEEPPYVEPVGPGELRTQEYLGRIGTAEITEALRTAGRQAPAVTPRYAVQTWRLRYLSSDANGQPLVVSGLLSVPDKPAGARSPVLGYQHGTLFRDAEAPSNHATADEAAVVMASLGYIVMAPDYAGYGASKGAAHPYLLAAPTAAVVIDGLVAARTWRARQKVRDNGQLFLAGYSEGGYATVAAHRGLQLAAAGTPAAAQAAALVMAVAGAGPYHVGVTMDALLERVRDENALLGLVISPGVLKNLGESVRRLVREALLREALPDDADVVFDTTFLDRYLDDDAAAIERLCNVHDWAPGVPVALYHGRDDRTVPYPTSTVTLSAMRARGALAVGLTDCTVSPAGHLECVVPYWDFMLARIGAQARDL